MIAMLSIFSQIIDGLPDPLEWRIGNFCHIVFDELGRDSSLDASVTQIRHFKEKDNLGHEFLLADVTYSQGQKSCILRLERSTSPGQRRSFLEKSFQTSSSIMPALDTVRISISEEQLTKGMHRGPFFPVATLPLQQKPLSLRELCLILSFFPAFSPQYNLRAEQCYWFCNVVLSTIAVACAGISIVEEEGFKKAGRFRKVSVVHSTSRRKLFIDAYMAVRARGESLGSSILISARPPLDAMPILAALLEVSSTEAKLRAMETIAALAQSSPEHRHRLVDAAVISGLISIITSSSPSMRDLAKTTLETFVSETEWPFTLETASLTVKSAYLLLTSPDPAISGKGMRELITCISIEGSNQIPGLTAMISVDFFKTLEVQRLAAGAIELHIGQVDPAIFHTFLFALSNQLSNPLFSVDMQRRVGDLLATVLRRRIPSIASLLQANIKGMLASESERLKELILSTLISRLPSEPLEKQLLNAGCLPVVEQLVITLGDNFRPLYIFAKICQHSNAIHQHDPRLPRSLIQWLEQGDRSQRPHALGIITKLASSQSFSEDICNQGALRVLARIRGSVERSAVVQSLCALSRWGSCRAALLDVGLIPSGGHDAPISAELVKAHLETAFRANTI